RGRRTHSSATMSTTLQRSRKTVSQSFLVVANSAVLTYDLRIKAVFFERLVRAGAGPPIGNLLDLSFSGGPHDLFPERKALLAYDVLQLFTLQVGMRCENAVRGVGAEHIEVAVFEAALALVEHLESLFFVLFQFSNCSLQHGLSFFFSAKLSLSRRDRGWSEQRQ